MRTLFVCQMFLVFFINGTKLTLKEPDLCPICGEETQIFYEQGSCDYCTLCTVRYISCNFGLLDGQAVQFYLIDIIFDKVNLSKENSCSHNDISNTEQLNKINKMVIKKMNDSHFARLGKEERITKMFQMLNDVFRALTRHKSPLFEINKCEFCSHMTFNKIRLDNEDQICFPCYSKCMKEKMTSEVFNKPSRQERCLKLVKMIGYKFSSFDMEMRKFFSIRAQKKAIFSVEETEIRGHIDWTAILSPRKNVLEYLQKQEDCTTVDYGLNFFLLAMILISAKNPSLDHVFWFAVHKLILDTVFVELKAMYLATKLTSIHKNINFRRAEFIMESAEKLMMMGLHTIITHWFHGSFDSFSPYLILCGILVSPLNHILTSFVLHLKKQRVLQEEYENFL